MRAALHQLNAWTRRQVNRLLIHFGYRLNRLSEVERRYYRWAPSLDSVPTELRSVLRPDHPRLRELREEYGRVTAPGSVRTLWNTSHLRRGLRLPLFRADNAYVWQFRNVSGDPRGRHYLYARYIAERDPRGLLRTLTEDGAFGCCTFAFRNLPTVSRDLLDSINEIYFLDRVMGLFGQVGLQVLDIGAGYGRLAHRMGLAVPGLERYWCVDAVPESTFLSEIYLQFRGVAKAAVIPFHRLREGLHSARISLAVNIHSFSEIGYEAIRWWLERVAGLDVRYLLIVPNDGDRLLSYERDGERRDFLPLLQAAGYRLAAGEPVVSDTDVRELARNHDRFYFFERN